MPPPFTAFPTAVQWSHLIVGPRLRPGDVVVDATAGNGHDTLFLAERVLPGGRVISMDLQAQAVDSTRRRLESTLGTSTGAVPAGITLVHSGHEHLAQVVPVELHGQVRAIMFNLGYLPGGDKGLVTQQATTLHAIGQALAMLAEDGVLTVVLYPGHEGGGDEASAVQALIAALPSTEYEAQRVGYVNFRPTTPFCLAVRRRSQKTVSG